MDAKFLVYLVSNLSVENLILEPLLFDYRNLMKTFPNCTVAYVYRKANRCVDKLVRMGVNFQSDHLILYNPLLVMEDLVIKPAIFVIGSWFFSFEYMLGYRLSAPKKTKKEKKNPSYHNNSYKSSRLSGWCSWLSR